MLKTDYVRLLNEVASFTDEDWWEGRVPDGTPDTMQLTADFVETGETVWTHPVFHREAFGLLYDWHSDEKLIKVQFFARHWVETYPEDGDKTTLETLKTWASGNYLHLVDVVSNRWPGHPEQYLYPFNLSMLALATESMDDFRMETRAEIKTMIALKQLGRC